MFAARVNQENAVYRQQTATATKAHGDHGLPPGTSADKPPKTPFTTRRNNENARGIAEGKGVIIDGQSGRNAFVTPAGPRTRAPLGMKTTNVKAPHISAFPVNQDGAVVSKPSSPRLRRPRIKVHEAAPVEAKDILESEEDDLEYMPPRETPLPDHPEDIWPSKREYPQFEGQNLAQGWFANYREESDTPEDALSDLEEKCRNIEEAYRKRRTARALAVPKHNDLEAVPPTWRARSAAVALANKPPNLGATVIRKTDPGLPIAATGSTMSRIPSVTRGNPRFNIAKAASKSTIGYSKGRTVSSFAREPLTQVHGTASSRVVPPIQKSITLDELLRLDGLDICSDSDGDQLPSSGHGINSLFDMDDDFQDFQLAPIETT